MNKADFRREIKRDIIELATSTAGPLPPTRKNDRGCYRKAYVNTGVTDFDNVGRIYTKCVNRTHNHVEVSYVPGEINEEDMGRLKKLRALYELTNKKFAKGGNSTEEEQMALLQTLREGIQSSSSLCSKPSRPLLTTSSSSVLGKRPADDSYTTPIKRAKLEHQKLPVSPLLSSPFFSPPTSPLLTPSSSFEPSWDLSEASSSTVVSAGSSKTVIDLTNDEDDEEVEITGRSLKIVVDLSNDEVESKGLAKRFRPAADDEVEVIGEPIVLSK